MSGRPTTAGRSDLNRATTSGVLWLLAQSLSARILGLVSQLALAALLMPADFGIIGLANTVTMIAQALVSFGVDDVLLQRQRTLDYWSAPAFWMSLGLGTLGMLIMIIAAPFAAAAYHSRDLVGLVVILAVAMPIRALATVSQVSLRARMNFRFLAAYNTFEIFGLQIGSIILAWCGLGAFSFAIPVPILAVIRTVLFWREAPPIIRRRFRRVQTLYMFRNSALVFLSRTIVEIVGQGDYMVLGLLTSHSVVGLYYFAFRFSAQPVRMLAGNFRNVLFPAFAELRNEPLRQAEAAYKASRLLSYLVVPFCFLQAALAEPGLRLLFGQRWLGSIPLVELLSIGLPFDAVSWITGSLLSARREFGRSLLFAAISAPFFFGVVATGAWFAGAIGVAAAVVVYYAIYPPICSILVLRNRQIGIGRILEFYLWPFLLGAGSMSAAYALPLALPVVSQSNFLRCVVTGCVGPGLYALGLFLFRRELFRMIASRFGGGIYKVRTKLGWQPR